MPSIDFGLGAKPGGPARLGANAREALRAEIQKANVAAIANSNLPSYQKACCESQFDFERTEPIRQAELNARIDKQMSVEIGFVERLVMFWSNHFSMSVSKTETIRGTIGQWERDVVRRHVLGHFTDMRRGTIEHPAMIAYLDNDISIGPNSPVGQSWGAGYNENLAREILELHTVGNGGGYSEKDVTAFAKMLTGWSYVRGWESDGGWNGGTPENRGRFIYRPDWHEPGEFTLMGKTYPALGKRQVERALEYLAMHPATAEHLAFKLVRHFITDEPTAAMVNPLKQKFLQTGGQSESRRDGADRSAEASSVPLVKLRTPYEYSIAKYRAWGCVTRTASPGRSPKCCGRSIKWSGNRARPKAILTKRLPGSIPTSCACG